jgi:hypothetical protein
MCYGMNNSAGCWCPYEISCGEAGLFIGFFGFLVAFVNS